MREETERAIDRLFPEQFTALDEYSESSGLGTARQVLASDRTGYISGVDAEPLGEIAAQADVGLRAERAVGDFIAAGEPLITLDTDRPISDEAARRVRAAFAIARGRTVDQDPAYGLRQLVDVALKALSPASNNVTTAIRCIDHLSALLCRLAGRRLQATAGEHVARVTIPGLRSRIW